MTPVLTDEYVEMNTNSNGNYLRIGKLLICWSRIQIDASTEKTHWTFPHSFTSNNMQFIGQHYYANERYGELAFGANDLTGVDVYLTDRTNGYTKWRSGVVFAIGFLD